MCVNAIRTILQLTLVTHGRLLRIRGTYIPIVTHNILIIIVLLCRCGPYMRKYVCPWTIWRVPYLCLDKKLLQMQERTTDKSKQCCQDCQWQLLLVTLYTQPAYFGLKRTSQRMPPIEAMGMLQSITKYGFLIRPGTQIVALAGWLAGWLFTLPQQIPKKNLHNPQKSFNTFIHHHLRGPSIIPERTFRI